MKQVLLVEDDTWQADILKQVLTSHGFTAEVVADGLAAFAAIDTHIPDVIVLDMLLPGPNGMAFLHELRSHADIAHIPVVACSNQPLTLKSLQPYGVVAVLDKSTMQPYDIVYAVRKACP